MQTQDRETYQRARERVLERLREVGLPWPRRPAGYGEEYEFPLDLTALTSEELSRLMSRLAAWAGYASRVLAVADAEYIILQQRFEVALGMKMVEIEESLGKRALKDTLRARALAADPLLARAAQALVEQRALVSLLKAQKEIYEAQYHALSREQSRRADELRSIVR